MGQWIGTIGFLPTHYTTTLMATLPYELVPQIYKHTKDHKTFLTLFCLSHSLKEQAEQQFSHRRQTALLYLLPNCFWALSMDGNTLGSLLWAYGEVQCRMDSIVNKRCVGALVGLHAIPHKRTISTGWSGGELFNIMHGGESPRYLAEPIPHTLLARHTDSKKSAQFLLTPLCGEQMVEQLKFGKYTRWWQGSEQIVWRLIYYVGMWAKEDISAIEGCTSLELVTLPQQQQDILRGLLKQDPPETFYDTVRDDFQRALKRCRSDLQ